MSPILLFALFFLTGYGQDVPYNRIYSQMLNNSTVYSKDIPPWEWGFEGVNVTIAVHYMGIISIEPNNQLVKYIAMLNITWADQRLQWDPAEMGTTEIMVPPGILWRPIVTMYNAVNIKDLKDQLEECTLLLQFTGRVVQLIYANMETYCSIEVEAFPFDEQYCPFSFTSVINSLDQIRLISQIDNGSAIITPYSISIPEWSVYETLAFENHFDQEGATYSTAQIVFHLKRNYEFYVFLLILPTFLVTSICIGALLLPIDLDLGEKINLGIAGLLSLTFLLSVMIGELPRAPGLPLMGKWVIVEMFFCFGSMLCPLAKNFLEKRLVKLPRKVDGFPLVDWLIFLLVTAANILTTLLMFLLTKSPPKPIKFIS